MALRVIFFGNSNSQFSNCHFQALLDASCNLAGLVDVPSIIRDSTNPVPEGLPGFPQAVAFYGVPSFEPANPNQPGFIAQMRALEPDLFLSIGYPKIFHSELLRVPRRLSVNFHASLLPAYRGKHPVFWCLRKGERWSGVTVHVMDPRIDTGDLLYQVRCQTRRSDSVSSLYDRIMERSLNLVSRLLSDIENGTLTRTPQPQKGASYYSSTTEQDFHLDWSLPAETLRRWIIITPGQCFALIRGERLFFLHARATLQKPLSLSGEIIRINPHTVEVATGDGLLHLNQLRLSDGHQMSLAAFCRQVGLASGDLLE